MSTNPAAGRVPELTLGWRLQMALAEGSLSVQEMAVSLGVSRSTISRWLHDEGMPPRAAFVKQWALATGVPADWLETGNAPAGPDGHDGGKDAAGGHVRTGGWANPPVRSMALAA